MKNGTAILQESLAVFHKAKDGLMKKNQQALSLVFTQMTWKLHPYKNVHINVYNNFIHNYQNLSLSR